MMVNDIKINSGFSINEEKTNINRLRNLIFRLEKNLFKKTIVEEDRNIIATFFEKIKKIAVELESLGIKSDLKENKMRILKSKYRSFLLFTKQNNQMLYKYKLNLTFAGLIYIIYSYIYVNEDFLYEEDEAIINKIITSKQEEDLEKSKEIERNKQSTDFRKVAESVNAKKRRAFINRVYISLNTTGMVISTSLTSFISLFRERNDIFDETIVILKRLGLK